MPRLTAKERFRYLERLINVYRILKGDYDASCVFTKKIKGKDRVFVYFISPKVITEGSRSATILNYGSREFEKHDIPERISFYKKEIRKLYGNRPIIL